MQNSATRSMLVGALIALGAVLLSNAVAESPGSRGTRVGFVNADRILREALPARLARQKIETEFSARQKEIDAAQAKNQQLSEAYQREAPTLADSERSRRQLEVINQDRYVQRLQRAYNEDVNARKSQELGSLQDLTGKAIKRIAAAQGYDLVLQDASFVNPRVDLTDQVIEELSKSANR